MLAAAHTFIPWLLTRLLCLTFCLKVLSIPTPKPRCWALYFSLDLNTDLGVIFLLLCILPFFCVHDVEAESNVLLLYTGGA